MPIYFCRHLPVNMIDALHQNEGRFGLLRCDLRTCLHHQRWCRNLKKGLGILTCNTIIQRWDRSRQSSYRWWLPDHRLQPRRAGSYDELVHEQVRWSWTTTSWRSGRHWLHSDYCWSCSDWAAEGGLWYRRRCWRQNSTAPTEKRMTTGLEIDRCWPQQAISWRARL